MLSPRSPDIIDRLARLAREVRWLETRKPPRVSGTDGQWEDLTPKPPWRGVDARAYTWLGRVWVDGIFKTDIPSEEIDQGPYWGDTLLPEKFRPPELQYVMFQGHEPGFNSDSRNSPLTLNQWNWYMMEIHPDGQWLRSAGGSSSELGGMLLATVSWRVTS